jgi:hypothetical protein
MRLADRIRILLVVGLTGCFGGVMLAVAPPAPRIESIVLAPIQPHQGNPQVIWYDDFDADRLASYLEPSASSPQARRSVSEALGGAGQSMECYYPNGSQGLGNRKLVFGDSPIGKPLRAGEKFEDIYWRLYVKHQAGWVGSPAKMSRATGLVSSGWNQAFISHVWSSGLPLTLDPATGVQSNQVVTTKYNDFDHLKWLGNKPVGQFPIHATEESGRWVCVESRIKLNQPGQNDGYAALWVDGRLDTERRGMDFRGSYTGRGASINAVFLEAYWNSGSPTNQYRWYDDFVVSTAPIGPLTATVNPTLIRTPSGDCAGWEAQISGDSSGSLMVWASQSLPGGTHRVTVTSRTGSFLGSCSGRVALELGPVYFGRVRQKNAAGEWSDWSDWHQPFYAINTAIGTGSRLEIDKWLNPDQVRFSLIAPSGGLYTVQSTSDFQAWRVVTNLLVDQGGAVFTDIVDLTALFSGRFYRAFENLNSP